jgi:hypothetical protein
MFASENDKYREPRFRILYLISPILEVLGLAASIFAIIFGIFLPVFVPIYIKWSYFWTLLSISGICVLIGPWLASIGLYFHRGLALSKLGNTLKQIAALQFGLGGLFWMAHAIYSLWKFNWLAFQAGPHGILTFWGLNCGPVFIALGISLLNKHNKFRDHLGMICTTIGYQVTIYLGLLIYYQYVAKQNFILSLPILQMEETRLYSLAIGLFALQMGIVGTLMMRKHLRLRYHLLVASPLWLPVFVLFFFWSMLLQTTLYFLDELLNISWQPSVWTKILLLSWMSLLMFPILLTADFCIGVVKFLGHSAVDRLFSPSERHNLLTKPKLSNQMAIIFGVLLLLTAPVWILPVFLYWSIRLFVYESLLLPLLGKDAVVAKEK